MTERLDQIARSLVDAARANARGERVSLPVIQPADAAGITNAMHARLDEAIQRRDEVIGARMACHRGCNACCTSPVLVTDGEGVAISEWLQDPAHAEIRAQFATAYASWRLAIGELEGQGDTDDHEKHHAWMLAVLRRKVMCAFNREGACTIYPVRPGICRKAHAIDTSEHCVSEDAGVKTYAHAETEQVFDGQRTMRFLLHKALRPDHRLDLLCSTVARLLGP